MRGNKIKQTQIITINEARKLLGSKWDKATDDAIEFLIEELEHLANIYIGNYLNSVGSDEMPDT
jgi:hypothetical protein